MFGKSYSEYVRYQLPILIAIAVIGFIRLGLSLAGQPDSIVRFFSMTVLGFAGIVYYAVTVRRSGFGSYRHMLPLIFNQGLIANGIAILGILISVFGMPNIYDVPEFRPPFARDATPTAHALAHLFLGTTIGTLVGWIFGSIVMTIGGRPRK